MTSTSIAVVGMAGRFPGASDVRQFWDNLRAGRESIRALTEEELRAAGVTDDELADASYVRATAIPDGYEMFDAVLFGYSAREARLIDPQHRLFLECCWEALEDAGYAPGQSGGSVGVYAGTSLSTYLVAHILAGRTIGTAAETLDLLVTNDKDYLATRVAYKLDLCGPAVAVQTACSSSLVAVHVAGQALLNGECDIALAGGAALKLPQPRGYRWEEGLIFSPDGHCRPFDADAGGTVFGSGAAVVVLKRLHDALADGDHIEAVIRGSATNNDGRAKVGYTAPGIGGQTAVIAAALGAADVEPDTITAVEAHGTATPVGDPIEIAALTRAFSAYTSRTGYCAIGSVKSNVGHLDSASGVTGLIKAILQVRHGELVPSLHYRRPNPQIDFPATPFTVSTELRPWETDGIPRRIGVSSFGMGGTNAHVILEQPPEGAAAAPVASSGPTGRPQILVLSAATPQALDDASAELAGVLAGERPPALPDVAHTLRVGRSALTRRRAVVARSAAAAAGALAGSGPEHGEAPLVAGTAQGTRRQVWLFPGQGSQYPGMGRGLYASEPVFARCVDECLELLTPDLAGDLRTLLLAPPAADAGAALARTELAQPALFVVEYALARLLNSWEVTPSAMLGHSVGEFAAACVAGVFTLPDALRLVAARGRLMQRMPPGAMLAVGLPEAELASRLPEEITLAAVNAPDATVVAGPRPAIEDFRKRLQADKIGTTRLRTSHAFHSAMMEPMLAEFTAELAGVDLRQPQRPYLSNLTGTWITAAEATDPGYWAAQARNPVRFADAIGTLQDWADGAELAFLEVGPGRALSVLIRRTARQAAAAALLPEGGQQADEQAAVLRALAQLWAAGTDIDLGAAADRGRRIPLPTYRFDRRRHWIDAPGGGRPAALPALDGRGARGGGAGQPADGALATQLDGRPPLATPYVAPRGDREAAVAEIWQNLLGAGPIGVDDNFIELGGHSLMATRMVEQIRAAFGVRLPLRAVLGSPTVAGVCQLIEQMSAGHGHDDLPRAVAEPDALHEPFPLTEIQQAQWIGRLGSFAGGNIAAHVYWEVEGDVDLARLERAWQRVMDRHPMLRAVLTADGRQRILPADAGYPIAVSDLSRASADGREAELASLRERLSHEVRPADQWPLFEIHAALLPGGRVRVFLSFDLLISDIGSIRLLMRDWGSYYREPDTVLPPLEISFRDYVTALGALREHPLYARSLDYWRERLPGLPGRPDLPLAVSPAAIGAPEFVARNLVIGWDRWRQLRERAGRHGLTVSSVVLAAYAATLGAWSRTGSFSLNVTVVNRLPFHPDVARLVGEFASFDLLPVDLASTDGIASLAARLQEQSWQDLEHRYVNGVEVLRELARAEGGAAGAVMPFVFTSTLGQDGEHEGESMFGWLGEVVHEIAQTPQVWIDCALLDTAEGVQLSWHAVHQLFPDGVLDAMFAAFGDLVGALTGGDEAWSGGLPALLPARDRAAISAANDTGGKCPTGLLSDPIVAHAVASPQATAVIAVDGQLSYGDLYRHACRLAWSLRAAGVQTGDLVAISIAKSCAQVVAALAVMLAGGAYLPVDPDLPAARQEQLLARGRARVVLTVPRGRQDWPDGTVRVPVDLDAAVPEDGPGAPGEPPETGQQPSGLAYVIFTSGSTGQPKGVMISHRAALNTVDDINARYGVGPGDRVLGVSSLSFDLSVYDIFGVLGAGGTLVLPRPGTGRDPAHWLEMIGSHGVTLWNSVPALAQMLADHALGEQLAGGYPGIGHPALESLRLMLLSGDWIPVDLPDRLRSVAPDAALVSLGGATEAAVWSIAFDIGAVDPAWESIPYGLPLRNQTMHVLNDRMQECPSWVTGELYIGGMGLAEGYCADPERTAASFVTHPVTGQRLYRTGDIGRRRPDGVIEFLGREDLQVKIGGFRIELGEVEAALGRVPGVAAAVAAAVGRDRHHRRLVGYLVPAEGGDRSPEADEALIETARRETAATLPSYMVPGTFMVIGQVPLSRNGKVDRASLPDPVAGTPGAAGTPGGDAGPVASVLAEIIREVVGVQAGPDDNFFALGGDSIVGVQVVTQATARGLPVTPADLFEAPTIRALAGIAGQRLRQQDAEAADVAPTPFQRVLLDIGQEGAGRAHWALIDPPGDLDSPRATEVMRRLQDRWPALRQRWTGDRLAVTPSDPGACHVPVIPLGDLPAPRREAAMAAMITDICAELDAASGPVVKASLFDLGDRRRLCVAALDLFCDGRSWPALLGAFADGCPREARPEQARPGWQERPEPGPAVPAAAVASMSAADTGTLLAGAAERYRLNPGEVVAVALAAALHSLGDAGQIAVAAEYDLRDDLATHTDTDTDAVGPYSGIGALAIPAVTDLPDLIVAVKRAYRAGRENAAGPGGGIPPAGLILRSLGGMPAGLGLDGTVRPAGPTGLVEVTSWRAGDRLGLAVTGDWPADRLRALADALGAACARLREHCLLPGVGALDPSDFPLADLSQEELHAFLAGAQGPGNEGQADGGKAPRSEEVNQA